MSRPRPGERVQVAGNVSVAGEDQKDHRGDVGRIIRCQNPRHERNGQTVVPVQLDNGEVIVVPEKALEHETRRTHG